MKSLMPILLTTFLVGAGTTFAENAQAGCSFEAPKATAKSLAFNPSPWDRQFSPEQAIYHPGADGGRFVLMSDSEDSHGERGIVGMWRFKLTGPGDSLVDDGYAQWHSDGTEIQNSGVHAPIGGNFCLGVWERVGPRTYKLNHFPLAWDSLTGQTSAVAIQLTETVTLIDENHLTGTFTQTAYPWDSTKGLTVTGPAVQTVNGTVTAERVTLSSTVPFE
jgi:hypothetical protein